MWPFDDEVIGMEEKIKRMPLDLRVMLARERIIDDPTILEALVAYQRRKEHNPNPKPDSEIYAEILKLQRYAYCRMYGIRVDGELAKEVKTIIGLEKYMSAKPLMPTNKGNSLQGKAL